MKRMILLALLPALVLSIQCKKKQENAVREGIVNALAGTVTITDAGKAYAAKVGDTVRTGMIIETGARSFVDIYFDQNAIKILEKTRVTIGRFDTRLADGAETSEFRVDRGRVFTKVVRKLAKNDRFTVSTPTTTAGVRGTEFLVESEELKSLIACLNGEVEVEKETASGGEKTAEGEKAVEGEKKTDGGTSVEGEKVILEAEQQVLVEKDKKMTVEELSEENRRLIRDIKRNFQDAKKEIRERFEKQRDEIRRVVEEQKEKNRDSIQRQKEMDRQNIEKQKAGDRENIERIKGTADGTKTEAEDAVTRQKDDAGKSIESVKPEIKKFKSTIE